MPEEFTKNQFNHLLLPTIHSLFYFINIYYLSTSIKNNLFIKLYNLNKLI